VRIGVEIGGTFTDLVLRDEAGELQTFKLPTTPATPATGAIQAVLSTSVDIGVVEEIVHGSTIATNGVIERTGARVGLLVTRGFGDLLELQRQARTNVFDLKYAKPHPLVPRVDVRDVDERVKSDGEVLKRPEGREIQRSVHELLASGVTSIAVCLLHSYAYPEHELLVRRAIQERWPTLPVTLSHEVAPIYREYERASTAVLSSYVMPIVDQYLGHLDEGLEGIGFTGNLFMMQSNGGVLPASLLRRHAVRTLLSGPAAGVRAAGQLSANAGVRNAISFDMGGTSTDVCLIRDGRAEISVENEIDNLPIHIPMIDLVTVGAGGGSIASVDARGVLQVGPRSAGATPGPASYGRGGSAATVTDANVVLGLIRPRKFLGGRMALDADAARRACGALGAQLGLDALGAARAMVRVVNATMEGALRVVSTERGVDPRDFWLISYGGAGGQHAAKLAEQLDLQGVIIPRHPGLFSAYGLLVADLQLDWGHAFLRPLDIAALQDLEEAIARLMARATAELTGANIDTAGMTTTVSLDMRYPGQAFEIGVPLPAAIPDAAELAGLFHASHLRRYGHAAPEEIPEIVTIRLSASIPRDESTSVVTPNRGPMQVDYDLVDIDGEAARVPFIDWDTLAPGDQIAGPAILEEESSAVWLPPGWELRCQVDLSVRLERSDQSATPDRAQITTASTSNAAGQS
jgi:N-methylhydantoinase A